MLELLLLAAVMVLLVTNLGAHTARRRHRCGHVYGAVDDAHEPWCDFLPTYEAWVDEYR